MATAVFRLFCLALLLLMPAPAGAYVESGKLPFLVSSISGGLPRTYVGQELILTYMLYFKDTAPQISDEVRPSLQGLWAKETEPERYIRSVPVTIRGEQFRSAVVKQFRLVPIQSGRLTVTGYSMTCAMARVAADGSELPDTRSRITAPAVTIPVIALPEPVPGAYSGAVGSFSMELLADRRKLRAGEALSLKIILSGTGSLLTLELPSLHLPESFRSSPPEITANLKNVPGPSSGTLTATIQAWPQSGGDFLIPPVSMVVFNPSTGSFSTILSKPLTITVEPAVTGTGTGTREPEHSAADPEEKHQKSLSLPLAAAALALILLLAGGASFIRGGIKRKTSQKTGPDDAEKLLPGSGVSAGNLKQQLFSFLEEAGIKSPGAMTRRELHEALMGIEASDEVRRELPEVLDALDRIMYSTTGEKEARTPELIAEKVSALMKALRKSGTSR